MQEFWETLVANFTSPQWLADQILAWIVFTVVVGYGTGRFVEWLEAQRQKKEREPYEGWKLRIIGYNDADQELWWEEVRRFRTSNFELWKFVKSVASGEGTLFGRSVQLAKETGWVRIEEADRLIIVDLKAIPPDQIQHRSTGPGTGDRGGHR